MENTKIAFVLDEVILCGGVKIPFGYCRELQKRGYDAHIYANGRNKELEDYYGVTVYPLTALQNFSKYDIIIAVWWRQIPQLEQYEGIKIQFVQGNDLAGVGDDVGRECLKMRQRDWDVLAVSDYAGKWTGKPYTVVPNAIDEIFFDNLGLERDIDALIEGNDEPIKNINYAIDRAKKDGHKKIVWFARQTHPKDGVINIDNPKQTEIPKLYQRSKHFYKYSLSEGFCLPLAEAITSGCEIHTWDKMGGNDFRGLDFRWETSTNLFLKYINGIISQRRGY